MPRASISPRGGRKDVDGVGPVGQVRPAVADHVVGGDAEVAPPGRRCRGRRPPGGRRCRAAAPGRARRRPAAPGCAPPRDVDVAQLVVDVGELAPDADVLGQVDSWVVPCGLTGPRGNRARASATVTRPALWRRVTPSGRAGGSSRWSGTRPARRPSRCSAGARSTAGCRRSRPSPRPPLVLDLAVAVAGDDVVHRLVVVALHVGALAGRDGLPEQLEGDGRQPPGDRQRRRVVHLRRRAAARARRRAPPAGGAVPGGTAS